tara:strand:+ start:3065 stop:3766 length:702 start_codon:yes stop_codon:yes gene_type:complete
MDHIDWIHKQQVSIIDVARPDWIYADIGSSRGEILTVLMQFMKYGHVFEPDPDNYSFLKAAIDSVETDNPVLQLNDLAITNFTGKTKLYLKDPNSPNAPSRLESNLLGHDMANIPIDHSIDVDCMTLDDYFGEKDVNFIKVDVEGAEWEVFEGATKLLERDNIVWQVEFHLSKDWHKIKSLYDLGYNLYDLDFNELPKDCDRQYLCYMSKNSDVYNRNEGGDLVVEVVGDDDG